LTQKILLGLGNPVGRDDAVGLRVAEALRGTEWLSIPAPTLENVLGLVEKEKPEKLVIVDAAEMGLPPGTIRRLPLGKGAEMLGSTHGLPLPFLLSLVHIPEVVLIGIQPKEYGLGEGLSPEAQAAADSLIRLLRENREHEIPELNLGQH
jgi:hydrogenase 3 maturation protease